MNWQARADTVWSNAIAGEDAARRNQWAAAMILVKRSRHAAEISEDTSTKLRAAWAMYIFIRAYSPAKARSLRARHGYRRFYELFTLWRLWEFDAEACIDHIESDLSTRAMAMQVRDVHDPRPEWVRKLTGVLRWVENIESGDAPEEVKRAAKVFKAALEKASS